MTWASLSLRKIQLKNRINNLESRLVNISQQLQTVEEEGANKQTTEQMWANYNLSVVNENYQNMYSAMMQASVNGGGQTSQADMQYQMYAAQCDYSNQTSIINSASNARANSIRSQVDAESSALEAEQVEVETQLSAARAEYENLSKAIDQDIKDGAIKLIT